MNKLNKDHLLGIICIALAIPIMIMAAGFPKGNSEMHIPGPGFFPMILGIVLILSGAYHVILGFVKQDEQPIDFAAFFTAMKSREMRVLLLVIALIVFFILGNEAIGFIPCLVIVLAATMRLLGVPWLSTLVGTVIIAGAVVLLFGTVFHVSLPSGLLSYIGL